MAPSALWFPPLINTLVAGSILYMAFENIAGARLSRRWLMTFAFGLVHGFAFAFAFKQTLQFAGSHVFGSLVAFNVGLELGQLLLLVLIVPALDLLFKYGVAERLGTVVVSALVAHTAWHWTWEHYGELVQYQFIWPVVDAAFLAGVLRWLMVLVILAGAWWVINGLPMPILEPVLNHRGLPGRTFCVRRVTFIVREHPGNPSTDTSPVKAPTSSLVSHSFPDTNGRF
jgi:hypothetical protein